MASVTRVVRFTEPRVYELIFEAFSAFVAPKDKEDVAATAFAKLQSIGVPKKDPVGRMRNPDLVLMTLEGPGEVRLDEREKDLVLVAIEAGAWPVYALALKVKAIDAIDGAEKEKS
jgi:hypothetical protein